MAPSAPDPVQALRDDFRRHLELFYAGLKLAPPYHSVEKAVVALTGNLKAMALDDVARVAEDPGRRWTEYRKAFVESGLHRKHHGIVVGLIRSKQTTGLPPEYSAWLEVYTDER
jgi:hypothetical protein